MFDLPPATPTPATSDNVTDGMLNCPVSTVRRHRGPAVAPLAPVAVKVQGGEVVAG